MSWRVSLSIPSKGSTNCCRGIGATGAGTSIRPREWPLRGPHRMLTAQLSNIVDETGAKTIHYLYDFGDSWDHVIKLEKWFDNTSTDGLPFLLEAAGRCPPEDVGGPPGYAEYLDAIGDPAHPEHEQMRRLWGPERFDPNVVDRKA